MLGKKFNLQTEHSSFFFISKFEVGYKTKRSKQKEKKESSCSSFAFKTLGKNFNLQVEHSSFFFISKFELVLKRKRKEVQVVQASHSKHLERKKKKESSSSSLEV